MNEITHFEALAAEVIAHGIPGSSAAGEHPKFLTRRPSDGEHVLVKFTPLAKTRTALRRQDILVAESLALDVFADATGQPRLSRILVSDTNLFFEIQRFDRYSPIGRNGLISLAALDNEFLGSGESWSKTVSKQSESLRFDEATRDEVLLREVYGRLIGNSDMHSGNLSFFFEDEKVQGLAPLYDMLPMKYAPYQDHISNEPIEGLVPIIGEIAIWDRGWELADKFWRLAAASDQLSIDFRSIAKSNIDVLAELQAVRSSMV